MSDHRIEDLVRHLDEAADVLSAVEGQLEEKHLQVKDLQRELEQWVKASEVSQRRIKTLEYQLAQMREALNGIIRFAELQASNKRGPYRTRGWFGAEKVGDAFGDIAGRARTALQAGGHG